MEAPGRARFLLDDMADIRNVKTDGEKLSVESEEWSDDIEPETSELECCESGAQSLLRPLNTPTKRDRSTRRQINPDLQNLPNSNNDNVHFFLCFHKVERV